MLYRDCRTGLRTSGRLLMIFAVSCAPPPRPEHGSSDFERRVAAAEDQAAQHQRQNRTRRFYDALEKGTDTLVPRLRGVIAVLNFPEVGGQSKSHLSLEVTEAIHHSLGRQPDRFSLVERSQIEQLVKERQYQQATLRMTDEEAARYLGRELNADAVVLGSISVQDAHVTVYMRIVAVKSAQVFGSARVGPLAVP